MDATVPQRVNSDYMAYKYTVAQIRYYGGGYLAYAAWGYRDL